MTGQETTRVTGLPDESRESRPALGPANGDEIAHALGHVAPRRSTNAARSICLLGSQRSRCSAPTSQSGFRVAASGRAPTTTFERSGPAWRNFGASALRYQPKEGAARSTRGLAIERQGFWAVGDAFRNSLPNLKGRALPGPDDYEQIPALAERGRTRTTRFFEMMDRHLVGQQFVAGDRYTIADIMALVTVNFAARINLAVPESCGHLRRWHEIVSARPSATA
ncbi:MAG TPA: glutathione binding-like protein [Stellaceae bacterium]|nr:glutathione binding-like protein [Stellaceae bacterium]